VTGSASTRAGLGTPLPVRVLAAIGFVFVAIPFIALLQRTPWAELPSLVTRPDVREALRLSILTSLAAMGLAIAFGVPIAWVLARTNLPGRSVARAIVTLPMVLPPVVGGAALLFALGRNGLVGQYLDEWFDIRLPFTTAAVVLAQTFVSMPFLVVTVEAALRSSDIRYEQAAATLGAGRWTTFRRVTLPSIAPSVLAGAVLCWARALGEFGATISFAGNLQGRTETVPLAIYIELQRDREAAIAMSLVLVAISLTLLVALRDRWYRVQG
jgi:molybdate transport system permease protein